MLTKRLRALISDAGRAAARERREDERQRRDVARTRAAQAEAEERACTEAPANAADVWTWARTDEADELRAAMREHGVERLQFGVWSLLRGGRCDALGFGTVSLGLVADAVALHVHVVRPGYVGHRSVRAHRAAELVDLVPALALAALADEIRSGRALDLVRRSARPA